MSDESVRLVDVFAEQVKLGAQLAVMDERLKSIPDHESRIRALERWRYALPTTIILALGSGVAGVLALIHH